MIVAAFFTSTGPLTRRPVDRPATAQRIPVPAVPAYLLRDRDAIFGQDFRKQLPDMGIEEVLSTPRSPWQRAYIERVIGSIRRECLDHVIVFNESSLRRILASYFDYYHRSRTHLSLGKDSPETRPVQPPEIGPVVAVRQAGGMHHRYEPRAALNIGYVLMIFSRPFRLHPLHLCSLVRRFSGSVRKFATRAARLVTVLMETHQRATRNFR
jgi:hypothetical protein